MKKNLLLKWWSALSGNPQKLKQLFFTSATTILLLSGFISAHGQTRGATNMPYVRFEAEDNQNDADGANIKNDGSATFLSKSFNSTDVQSEASNRKCAQLTSNGDWVSWLIPSSPTKNYKGFTLRFSIPDGISGGGTTGTFALEVKNGTNWDNKKNFQVTSKWAYQYFKQETQTGSGACGPIYSSIPYNNCSTLPSAGAPIFSDPYDCPQNAALTRMRFDEVHILLSVGLTSGQEFRIRRVNGTSSQCYVDFVELEEVGSALTPDAGFDVATTVSQFNALLADTSKDIKIFLATGDYDFPDKIQIPNAHIKVTIKGAGIWYTNLHFTGTGDTNQNGNGYLGGIEDGSATKVDLSNFYMNTELTIRTSKYSGFFGTFGTGSKFSDIWLEHFSTGAWIAKQGGNTGLTDGLAMTNLRVRNTYADGINLNADVKNTTVSQCNMRNTGDDSMAFGPGSSGAFVSNNNKFYNNTAENTWRAGGMGLFAGQSHEAYLLKIKDSETSGMRFYTSYDVKGLPTSQSNGFQVHDIDVIGCGSLTDIFGRPHGAVDFLIGGQLDPTGAVNYDLAYFTFSNINIINSPGDAFSFSSQQRVTDTTVAPCLSPKAYNSIHDVSFSNITVNNINLASWAGQGYLIKGNPNVQGEISFTGLVTTNIPKQRFVSTQAAQFIIKTALQNSAVTVSIPQSDTSGPVPADGSSFKYNQSGADHRVIINTGAGIPYGTITDDIQSNHLQETGDFTLTAKAVYVDPSATSGIMIRKTSGSSASYYSVNLTQIGAKYTLKISTRTTANAASNESTVSSTLDTSKIYELQLVRAGTTYTASYRIAGASSWTTAGTPQTIGALSGTVIGGAFFASNDVNTPKYGLFDDVNILAGSVNTPIMFAQNDVMLQPMQPEAKTLTLYPNPLIGNSVTIKGNTLEGAVEVEIGNVSYGYLTKTKTTASNNTVTLPVYGLRTGIYMVRFENKGELKVFKLIVP